MSFKNLFVYSALLASTRGMALSPETPFQRDRGAIRTILDSEEVRARLADKGSIVGISAIDRRRNVYVVSTPDCELHVQFVRACEVHDRLPQCEDRAKVLVEESVGRCEP
jgi:hypothetical protein